MQVRGQHVVLLILVIGVLLGAYAWWHAYYRGRRSLDHWGSQQAVLIRYAPTVELWELQRSGADAAANSGTGFQIDDQPYSIVKKTDISHVKGLVHARHALVEDASFQWEGLPSSLPAEWTLAMHFAGPDGAATVLFDTLNGQLIELKGDGGGLQLQPELMDSYKTRSVRWVAEVTASAEAGSISAD